MSVAAQVIKAMAKGAKEGAKKGADAASKTKGGGKADGVADRIDKHIEALLTSPTKGQQKVENAVKSQRVYRQGQNKAGAAGTAAGAGAGAGAMYFMMDVGGEKVSVPADKAKNPDKLKTSDVEILEEKEASDFEKAFSEAFENGEETFMWNGKEYAVELKAGDRTMKAEGGMMQDEINKYKMLYSQMEKSLEQAKSEEEIKQIKNNFAQTTEGFDGGVVTEAYKQLDAESQAKKKMAVGGEASSLFVPPEMQMESDVPEDTYPNIPEDEMDDVMASQKPDDVVEDDYVSYVMSEVLSEEEVDYVNSMLETDDKLSQIFDKLILSASEFNGSGEVEGPGDGTSDDIPARLSDGEFVFTKKATDQLGAENLQSMMDDAERAYDGGLMKKAEGGLMYDPIAMGNSLNQNPSAQNELDVQRQMLRANRMPSLIGG